MTSGRERTPPQRTSTRTRKQHLVVTFDAKGQPTARYGGTMKGDSVQGGTVVATTHQQLAEFLAVKDHYQ